MHFDLLYGQLQQFSFRLCRIRRKITFDRRPSFPEKYGRGENSQKGRQIQTLTQGQPKKEAGSGSSAHSFMMPVYLASALVLHRKEEVLSSDCDMASVHSVLSHIPPDLPLEKLLRDATKLSQRYPSATLEQEVSCTTALFGGTISLLFCLIYPQAKHQSAWPKFVECFNGF